MNIEYTGRHHTHFDDELRQLTEDRIGRVIKFLDEPIEVHVTMDHDKRSQHLAEIHIKHKQGSLVAKEEATHLREAIQAAMEKVEKQARRGRKKLVDQRRRGPGLVEEVSAAEAALADSSEN
ncbi:MAG: ribosome-associated translation inhibitor RaiA [Acidobacteriota bacterium]